MADVKPIIEESWKEILSEEFKSSYFADIKDFLVEEKKKYIVYPPGFQIFSAFNYTPFNDVKVVIIGRILITEKGRLMDYAFLLTTE